jgi:hypothetical protein
MVMSPQAGEACRRFGVSASGELRLLFDTAINDQEVATELMTLCKRRHADTPIRRYVPLVGPF